MMAHPIPPMHSSPISRASSRACASAATAREQGQALVEFALAFGVLIMLFLGIVGMAWTFFAWLSTSSAAREGARFVVGESDSTDSEVIAHICNTTVALGGSAANCNNLISGGDVTVSIEPTAISSRVSGAQITVNVAYRVPVPTLRASFINGGGITFLGPIWVNSRSVMRIE